jgi:glycosyltransferase involved in cell wall biosynthesis
VKVFAMALDKGVNSKVDILLSTFNGEKYLPELLDSVINQSYGFWRLIVRDDGSNDKTKETLNYYKDKCSDKIVILEEASPQLGPRKSFLSLLSKSFSPYIMFCDQDDVWLPDKIEVSLDCLKKNEIENPGIPLVVFSDMVVVDEKLRTLNESFFKGLSAPLSHISDPYYLVYRNVAAGCSMLANRKAVSLLDNITKNILMHDGWLMIATALSGKNIFIPRALVKYRIHGENVIGFKESSGLSKSQIWLHASIRTDNLKNHFRLIRQGIDVFRCNDKKFSVFIYVVKIINANYLFPFLARVFLRG